MSILLLSIIASSANGIFIELESSIIGSEPKEFSATLSNSASVSNSVSVPNLQSRQRSGHKAIRMKLRNLFNLNSIKANLKLKQTTTVGQTIDQGSTSHESKLDISLRKQPSFFAPGRVAFRETDVCDLPPKIPYWWRKCELYNFE